MKLRCGHIVLLGLVLACLFIGCKTTGDTGPDTLAGADSSVPANEAALAALDTAKADTEAARSRAMEVQGQVYYPGEWAGAEERFEANDALTPATRGEAGKKAAEWESLTAVYDEIFQNSLPRFIADKKEDLDNARESAVDAGVPDILPDRFAAVDELAGSAREKYDQGDYRSAAEDGNAALDRYMVLKTIAEAYNKQQEVDGRDFYSYDPENYDLAADSGNAAVEYFDNGSLQDAQDAADESLVRFNLVLRNGWIVLTGEKASEAGGVREACREVKANVAVRQDYDAAEEVYNQAHVALRAEEYADAADMFEQSTGLYARAYDTAVEKRIRAETALREAEQKVADSEAKAQSAEELIGGGE
jgi:hypothetical protein